MKTASQLFTEYYDKPPQDRINSTVQNYVFDYQQSIIDEQNKRIDQLKSSLKRSNDEKIKYYNQVLNRQEQIEYLQKQAESAIKHLDSIDNCLKTYGSKKAKRILKGEKDD